MKRIQKKSVILTSLIFTIILFIKLNTIFCQGRRTKRKTAGAFMAQRNGRRKWGMEKCRTSEFHL